MERALLVTAGVTYLALATSVESGRALHSSVTTLSSHSHHWLPNRDSHHSHNTQHNTQSHLIHG